MSEGPWRAGVASEASPDYQPVSLEKLYSGGVELLPSTASLALGAQTLRGLPFQLGSDPARCFVALGTGLQTGPMQLAIGRQATSVVVAHRLLESNILEGEAIGALVAEYIFHYRDGQVASVSIRERFEIAAPGEFSATGRDPKWGHLPFLALPDANPQLPPRHFGPFAKAGYRQTALRQEPAVAYYLWAWMNPRPDVPLDAMTFVPHGPRFVIAGVITGHVDEHPLVPAPSTAIKITLKDGSAPSAGSDLTVEVDRGSSTFPYFLHQQSAEEFVSDPLAGWGESPVGISTTAYAVVAANPSATITIRRAGDVIGSVPWKAVESRGVHDSNNMRIEAVGRERNWVRTTVVDEDSGTPIPCRIHFRSDDGIPYQPHGHHSQVNGDLDSWHIDVGGDVRLGHTSYAYIDGTCQGWLPRGRLMVEVARGFEYEPIRELVTIEPGQQRLTLSLRRIADLKKKRWFSGDTHVHFLSTQGSHTEAQGEDLSVVNLLLSQWGHLFTNTEEFIGRPSVSANGESIVYASQENRQHMLGHLSLLGLKRAVMPWCSDGPAEAEMGGSLEVTLADWADQCHAQGGTVVLPHMPIPNGEPAALIATGRVDAVEMVEQGAYFHNEYYRYLNGGYRLPLVGGTDKMSNDVPVGLYRTYVYIPPDEEFNYDNWCSNLRAGRTFLSGGPLITLTIDGKAIGDTVLLPPSGGSVEVEARVDSIFPVHTLELVERGKVVASTTATGARTLRLKERLNIKRHTWLAARTGGPNYFDSLQHRDEFGRRAMAHTSPIYVACGEPWQLWDPRIGEYMLSLVEGSLSYMGTLVTRVSDTSVTHHHGQSDHMAYLQKPFLEAAHAIRHRLSIEKAED